ncbi:MAG: S8 family serine peptidase [Candidatus Sericytochromatia bacterium]|nr:S8 family serine peptidase [Candidatus Tanganyikabacteria bacterium]
MADLVARLAADPAVAAAEANQPLNLVTRPIRLGLPAFGVGYNDPLAGRQWAVARIALAQAHAKTRSSSRTVVAVLDTGVDWSHPDFRAPDGRERVIRGRDWLKNTDFPRDGGGHGTHVAGIVGASADNALGTVGVAPDCTILAEKVTSDYGFGEAAGVAGAIIHATDAGARILTMSLGSPTLSQVVKDAVSYAQARDVLVVAAMGNSGRNEKLYPAALPGVMAVGATDDADRKASFSTFGDWISVAAPGTNILSTLPTFDNQTGFKDYGWMQGTSMATPHVAGLAALVRDLHPEMSAAATKKRIEQTALRPGGSGFSAELGFGRIDARRAVD